MNFFLRLAACEEARGAFLTWAPQTVASPSTTMSSRSALRRLVAPASCPGGNEALTSPPTTEPRNGCDGCARGGSGDSGGGGGGGGGGGPFGVPNCFVGGCRGAATPGGSGGEDRAGSSRGALHMGQQSSFGSGTWGEEKKKKDEHTRTHEA